MLHRTRASRHSGSDQDDKVVEVTAVKTYSLEITTGKGCRNVKGKKYAASFSQKKRTQK